MKHILYALVFFVFSANAQDINSLFVAMPDSLSPLLTKVNKQDFADFISSGMNAVVKNKFGGDSEMTRLTENYLQIKVTDASSQQMKLLPLNDSVNVICVVNTYSGPVEDSKIRFYSEKWESLPTEKFISLPALSDFSKGNDKTVFLNFKDMFLYSAELSETKYELSLFLNSMKATDDESEKKYSPDFLKSIKYIWRNGRFEKD